MYFLYWKVTEFLNDDKITCLQRPVAFAINGVYWRTEWCGYLCRWIDYLCKICLYYLCFISIFHRHITKLYIAPWLSEACKPVLPSLNKIFTLGRISKHLLLIIKKTQESCNTLEDYQRTLYKVTYYRLSRSKQTSPPRFRGS